MTSLLDHATGTTRAADVHGLRQPVARVPAARAPRRPRLRTLLTWTFAYQRPLRRAVARRGLLRAAPVALAFLAVCLLVSALWAVPGPTHRLAAACCAYWGWHQGIGPWDGLRLVGSAFVLRHSHEVAWTLAATLLVTAPFEALVGHRRMLVIVTLGHVGPTLAVAAAGLSQNQHVGGGGLDVGASAVVVAAAAGLAVRSRSLAVTAWLVVAQVVDVLVETPLAAAEHLMAIGVGALATLALTRAALPTPLGRPGGATRIGAAVQAVEAAGSGQNRP
jgi:hypothetical protein